MIRKKQYTANEYNSSGFGTKVENHPERLINQDGNVNVKKTGLSFFDHFSIFHFLVTTTWTKFNMVIIASYLLIITVFGYIYYLLGIEQLGLAATNPGNDFLNSIYFSSQTFSTVGYGRANPIAHAANMIAVSEMLIGMMYLALAAGLLFARFSRPVAKIVFSNKALIAPYRQGRGFMLRLSNAKSNMLLDLEAKILLVMVVEENGTHVRKFYDLPLEMSKINMLAMSWTLVHPIDESSPIYSLDIDKLKNARSEFMVLIKGYNDTMSQAIHSRTSYKPDEIEWGARFSPIFTNSNGITGVAIDQISNFERVNLQ